MWKVSKLYKKKLHLLILKASVRGQGSARTPETEVLAAATSALCLHSDNVGGHAPSCALCMATRTQEGVPPSWLTPGPTKPGGACGPAPSSALRKLTGTPGSALFHCLTKVSRFRADRDCPLICCFWGLEGLVSWVPQDCINQKRQFSAGHHHRNCEDSRLRHSSVFL